MAGSTNVPLVSIVVPCFNAEKYVGEAIESALRQTYRCTEVIVIDDGSKDKSLEVIKSFGDRVRWETGPNRGGSAARNQGMKLARGEYLQFLDADDILFPAKLEAQVQHLRDLPRSSVSICDADIVSDKGEFLKTLSVSVDDCDPVVSVLGAGIQTMLPLHPAHLVRAVGGFDESLPCAQERDFHLREACAGARFYRMPRVLCRIRKLRGSVSSDSARVYRQHLVIAINARDILHEKGALNESRARALAGFLAKDARKFLRMGLPGDARTYFDAAYTVHSEGGLKEAYSPLHRLCAAILGRMAFERLVVWRRSLASGGTAGARQATVQKGKVARSVVFCVFREVAGPVFFSQVVGPVAWAQKHGYDVHLTSFVPLGGLLRRSARRHLGQIRSDVSLSLGGKASWLWTLPSRFLWPWWDCVLLRAWLKCRYGQRPVLLHCRGSYSTSLALRVRERRHRTKVLFDCRGVSHAEYGYEHDPRDPGIAEGVARRHEEERRCATESDAILCVSRAMANYLVHEFSADRSKMAVIPCCVDARRFIAESTERNVVRDRLGLTTKFVVTYCGGLHKWQLPEQCITVFKLVKTIAPTSHFLALTTRPEAMRRMTARSGLSSGDVTVMTVSHADVPRYLAAGDLGLLLRERSTVNEVASPVKFAEYLACGLPVVLTAGIGDYSELAAAKQIGLVLDLTAGEVEMRKILEEFLSGYMQEPEVWRSRCRRVASEELSSQSCYGPLAHAYERFHASAFSGLAKAAANHNFTRAFVSRGDR